MLLPLLVCAALAAPSRQLAPAPPDDRAHALVRAALDGMGGEAAMRAIATLRLEGYGSRNLLEQSERPDGPWIPQRMTVTEAWDLRGGRWRATNENQVADATYTEKDVLAGGVAARAFGERWLPAPDLAREGEERTALLPHVALLDALDAPDLHALDDVPLQGLSQHVVAYTWRGRQVRVLLNPYTGLPTAAEIDSAYPDDVFWGVWGDVTTRLSYSFWDLLPGGIHYPLQWDLERRGLPDRTLLITRLALNPALPDGTFSLPEDVRRRYADAVAHGLDDPALGSPSRPAVTLAEGVVYVPGRWGVTLVRQDDGVVVLDAPISGGYSRKVMAEAARRFPGLPIKAVVTTSDAWPHFGGVREYVSAGVPVYLLDLNVPQIQRALDRRHTRHPDTLERRPRAPVLHVVAGRTIVGAGSNRIELYPIRSETGERMMMAYLPERRLLYASDLVQLARNGPPQYVSELVWAAEREGLKVDRLFAMHTDPTDWSRILDIAHGHL